MTRLRHVFTRMPLMGHRWIRASLAGYVDGTLEPASRVRLALHLSACPDCLMQVAELRRLEALLADDPATPEVSFTKIWLPLRDRIRATKQKPARRVARRVGLALALAAIASSFGVIAFAVETGRIVIPTLPLTPATSATPSVTIGSRITPSGAPTVTLRASASGSKSTTTAAPSASRAGGEGGRVSPSASPSESSPSSDMGSPSPSASSSSSSGSDAGPSSSASASPSGSGSDGGSESSSGSDGGSSSPSASPSS